MKLKDLVRTSKNYQSIKPLHILGVPHLGLGHSYGVDLLNLESGQIKKVELENISLNFGKWSQSKFNDIILFNNSTNDENYLLASHSFVGVLKVPLSDFYINGNTDKIEVDSGKKDFFIIKYCDGFLNPMGLGCNSKKIFTYERGNLGDLISEGSKFKLNKGHITSMCCDESNVYLGNNFGGIIKLNLKNNSNKIGCVSTLSNECSDNRLITNNLQLLENSKLVYSVSSNLFSLDIASGVNSRVKSFSSPIMGFYFSKNEQELIVLTEGSLSKYVLGKNKIFELESSLSYNRDEKINSIYLMGEK